MVSGWPQGLPAVRRVPSARRRGPAESARSFSPTSFHPLLPVLPAQDAAPGRPLPRNRSRGPRTPTAAAHAAVLALRWSTRIYIAPVTRGGRRSTARAPPHIFHRRAGTRHDTPMQQLHGCDTTYMHDHQVHCTQVVAVLSLRTRDRRPTDSCGDRVALLVVPCWVKERAIISTSWKAAGG